MQRFLSLILLTVFPCLLPAQTLVIDARGTPAGTYYARIQVSDGGAVQWELVNNVVHLGGTTPPEPPAGELTTDLARAAHRALGDIQGDPDREHNTQQLAVAFAELASRIGSDFKPAATDTPWQSLADVTREVRRRLLGGTADKAWQPWVKAVAAEMAKLEAADQLDTVEQMKAAYQEVSKGLDYAPAPNGYPARRRLSPEMRELIIQIIRMVIEALLKGATS
jgi:hypothetical protein